MAETIKITLELNLNEEDLDRTVKRAARYGIGFKDMIEGFIADLSGKQRRNGSDESDLADAWMRRSYYCPYTEQTFLSFLMEEGYDPDEIAKALWLLENSYESLADAECKEESDEISDEIEENLLELEELFTRYQQELGVRHDMAEAFKGIYDFYCALERLKGKKPVFTVNDSFWTLCLNAEDGNE
ncbi:MAG: hypothetical protein IK016_06505 [Lachnospiraceae bacterium]|nr:hypothetical protein [Lachnospiraceae bacterium]